MNNSGLLVTVMPPPSVNNSLFATLLVHHDTRRRIVKKGALHKRGTKVAESHNVEVLRYYRLKNFINLP